MLLYLYGERWMSELLYAGQRPAHALCSLCGSFGIRRRPSPTGMRLRERYPLLLCGAHGRGVWYQSVSIATIAGPRLRMMRYGEEIFFGASLSDSGGWISHTWTRFSSFETRRNETPHSWCFRCIAPRNAGQSRYGPGSRSSKMNLKDSTLRLD
ncbi:hypothetical protein B0H12DRAFT_457183 [Mycena haematopus]|nr:hypothetical protein B0H12DRAFT_457183 [Mycena haematopus]